MFDFRRKTLFCLGYRLSKHKMTIYSLPPLATPMLSAGSDSLYLQFKPTIWFLSYLRKHTNCSISLQERHFPTPLRHQEKQQFYWNWATLPLQSISLQSAKCNFDKPTQWLGQRGPTTFDLRVILQKRGYFRTTSNKMI